MVQRPQCGRLLTSTHTPGQPVRLLGCAMDAEVIKFFVSEPTRRRRSRCL